MLWQKFRMHFPPCQPGNCHTPSSYLYQIPVLPNLGKRCELLLKMFFKSFNLSWIFFRSISDETTFVSSFCCVNFSIHSCDTIVIGFKEMQGITLSFSNGPGIKTIVSFALGSFCFIILSLVMCVKYVVTVTSL